ncbi:MAG: hypothetical protein ACREYF_15000, partial [Gammaproteobacteria bacterium]
QNIDDFNRGVALILAHLYQRFPIPAMLKVAELDAHEDLLPEETERRDSRQAVYGAAIEFLAEEGYLRFHSHAGRRALFANVVLTSKGLSALQKTPEAMLAPSSRTVGDTLIEATGDLLKDSAKELIRQAIRIILG